MQNFRRLLEGITMTHIYIMNENDEVIPAPSPEAWGNFMFMPNSRKFIRTSIPEKNTFVSTYFLGLDHSLGGKPKFFETLVSTNYDQRIVNRYMTFEEARTGHWIIVE
jgi:hypothetical protein